MSDYIPGSDADRFIKTTAYTAGQTRYPHPAGSRTEAQDISPRQVEQDTDFQNWQLSGLFTVPAVDLPLTIFLYVSSHIQTAETVQLQINLVTDSVKTTIFQTAVVVPARGAVQVQFNAVALGLMGQTLEVLLRSAEFLNIFQLFPSINIVQTFPADGSTLPLLFIPPANFQQIFPVNNNIEAVEQQDESNQEQQPLPPILLTTGIFEVPQGVFAVRPLVQLELSNFFDQTLTAEVEVNRLVRGTTTKERVLQETVEVTPNGARRLEINQVEGLPAEINLALSRTEEGDTLQPSVNLANVFMVAETVDLVLFIPAGQFMGILPIEPAGLPRRAVNLQYHLKQGGAES